MPPDPQRPVTNEDPSGPLSWRDVYKAVGDSEARVIAAITNASQALQHDVSDHESRLRAVELAAVPALTTAQANTARLTILEDKFDHREALQSGVFSTIGATRSFVILGMAVMGTVVAGIDLITRLTSP